MIFCFVLINQKFALNTYRDIVRRDPEIKWHTIQGNDDAKEILKESVILPLQHPELFNGFIKPWRGILLHGPPGNGKTMLAKALNSETFGRVTFFNVIPSTIISKWRGDSEKFIRVCPLLYCSCILFTYFF